MFLFITPALRLKTLEISWSVFVNQRYGRLLTALTQIYVICFRTQEPLGKPYIKGEGTETIPLCYQIHPRVMALYTTQVITSSALA